MSTYSRKRDPAFRQALTDFIDAARRSVGMSWADVARATGIHPTTLARRRKSGKWRYYESVILADALGFSVVDLAHEADRAATEALAAHTTPGAPMD